jgi:hypothetical protein
MFYGDEDILLLFITPALKTLVINDESETVDLPSFLDRVNHSLQGHCNITSLQMFPFCVLPEVAPYVAQSLSALYSSGRALKDISIQNGKRCSATVLKKLASLHYLKSLWLGEGVTGCLPFTDGTVSLLWGISFDTLSTLSIAIGQYPFANYIHCLNCPNLSSFELRFYSLQKLSEIDVIQGLGVACRQFPGLRSFHVNLRFGEAWRWVDIKSLLSG